MNVFENAEFLLGVGSSKGVKDSLDRFFNLTTDLKESLGDKKELINEYLSAIFNSLNYVDILFATTKADRVYSNVMHSCRVIVKGAKVDESKPFFKNVKNYMEKHPCIFTDIDIDTKIYYYVACFLINNIDKIHENFLKQANKKILNCVDYGNMKQKCDNLAGSLDEKRIAFLNELISENFIICPLNMIFGQTLMLQIVEIISRKASKTNVSIFEMIISERNKT